MAVEAPAQWRRLGAGLVGLIVLLVFGTTWLASDRSGVHELGVSSELLIVNDAGAVRVRSLDSYDGEEVGEVNGGAIVRTAESWLLRGPLIEQLIDGDSSAFRMTCPSRFPCRATLEVFVPDGVALSIVAADDLVQVDAFNGSMSIFAGDGGVVLGTVTGSVSIISDGPVTGTSLGPAELSVDVVDDDVSLTFLDSPTVLAVLGGEGSVTIEVPPGDDYAIDAEGVETEISIETEPTSDRLISVRSAGSVSIDVSGQNGDG